MRRAAAILGVWSLVGAALAAQQPGTAPAHRDLSGIWQRNSQKDNWGFTVVGDEPVMMPWADTRFKAARDGASPASKRTRATDKGDPILYPYCFPVGMPRSYDYNSPFEIVQTPGRVYMHFEVNGQARRIYLDGRKHPGGDPPTFMGHSTGAWEGNTLVVETVGLNDLTWLDGLGRPHSDALRMVERIRRVAKDRMDIDFLFDDPKAYQKPWRATMMFQSKPDWDILEHIICESVPERDDLVKLLRQP